mmetsp:Transcript_64029/g.111742  ORF Transcript_64029/g.111742 Transcript_64029/m.111742 type:complete len:162 (+) Transcript_64029:1-486(+)
MERVVPVQHKLVQETAREVPQVVTHEVLRQVAAPGLQQRIVQTGAVWEQAVERDDVVHRVERDMYAGVYEADVVAVREDVTVATASVLDTRDLLSPAPHSSELIPSSASSSMAGTQVLGPAAGQTLPAVYTVAGPASSTLSAGISSGALPTTMTMGVRPPG